MDIESLKSLFSDFDVSNFLPELDTVMGWVETLLRIAVMAGPLIVLGLGLLYFLAPPKEANHSLGYRCYFGMGSVEAWQFTQRFAGMIFAPVGLLLTIIMGLICNGYRNMEPDAMVFSAVKCLIWEVAIIAVCCLTINIVVMCLYDRNGSRRPNTAKDQTDHKK